MNPLREKLYLCAEHLLRGLLDTTDTEPEIKALYRAVQWLGIAQLRAVKANNQQPTTND